MTEINELKELGYVFYTHEPWIEEFIKKCPECTFIKVKRSDCIKHGQTQTLHACIIREDDYEHQYPLQLLERIKGPVINVFFHYLTRSDWPLRDRVSDMVMRLFESGVIDIWKNVRSNWARDRRLAMEAECSSPQYRPVTLYQLKFAFLGLALGFSTATIVFFLELSPTMWKLMKRRLAECRLRELSLPKCRLTKCRWKKCRLPECSLAERSSEKCGARVLELLVIFPMCWRSLRRLREHVIQNRA